MALKFGGTGVPPGLRGLGTNWYALPAGSCAIIPSGTWVARIGKYLTYQEFDAVNGIWRSPGGGSGFANTGDILYINSDGENFRIANQTGCVVGAYPSTAGSGYSSPPTITTASGALFQAIIGGAINTSVTISNGGQSYVYPPSVIFAAPPFPGLQATGYATLSAGVVTGVTVVDQGAGYSSAPTINFVNDPRDTTGFGAQAQCLTTGAGTLTGVICTDFGSTISATYTSLPTLTVSGGGGSSAAATAIMCGCLTSYTISNGGGGLGTTGSVTVTAPQTGFPTSPASVLLNPSHQSSLVRTRPAIIIPTLAGNAISAVGTVQDGGIYSGVTVTLQAWSNAAVVSTAVSLTAPVFSGLNDVYGLMAA